MKTTANIETVRQALETVNMEQGYSLEFKRLEQAGKKVLFTIKSASKIPGAKVSHSGRNIVAASWHAHGYMFEAIFRMEPEAVIYSMEKKITKDAGNWIDYSVGTQARPVMASQLSIL